jgi:hypothetical protein
VQSSFKNLPSTPLAQHPPCAEIVLAPVVAVEFFEPNGTAAIGCVHEAALADVDADVVHRSISKEQQVGRCEVVVAYRRNRQRRYVAGAARQAELAHVSEHEVHQSAAIETACGRIAAPFVRGTDKADRADQYTVRKRSIIGRHVHDHDWRNAMSGFRRRPRRVLRAGGEQRGDGDDEEEAKVPCWRAGCAAAIMQP